MTRSIQSPVPFRACGRRGLRVMAAGIVLLALLAGCELKPTPYQPLGESGGYEQARLGPRIYRVSFRGNRATPETRVLDFLYVRCAQLTQQAGYTHFVVEENYGQTQTSLQAGPGSSVSLGVGMGGPGSFWGMGFGAPLGQPNYESVVDYHLAIFVIRMLTDEEAKKAEAAGSKRPVYDAAYLIKSLHAETEAGRQAGS